MMMPGLPSLTGCHHSDRQQAAPSLPQCAVLGRQQLQLIPASHFALFLTFNLSLCLPASIHPHILLLLGTGRTGNTSFCLPFFPWVDMPATVPGRQVTDHPPIYYYTDPTCPHPSLIHLMHVIVFILGRSSLAFILPFMAFGTL